VGGRFADPKGHCDLIEFPKPSRAGPTQGGKLSPRPCPTASCGPKARDGVLRPRIAAVRSETGSDIPLMVDANQVLSVAEALRRSTAYADELISAKVRGLLDRGPPPPFHPASAHFAPAPSGSAFAPR
jgi:hypothetical protein